MIYNYRRDLEESSYEDGYEAGRREGMTLEEMAAHLCANGWAAFQRSDSKPRLDDTRSAAELLAAAREAREMAAAEDPDSGAALCLTLLADDEERRARALGEVGHE